MRRPITLLVALALVATTLLSAIVEPPSANGQVSDTFSVIVLPDTQIYVQSEAGAEIFVDQFAWIVDQQIDRNIVFVSHEGDVSQNPSSVTEWDRIEVGFALLDDADIPYGIAAGNHDINRDGTAPEYDTRFGASRYVDREWFAGRHEAEGTRSSYQTVAIDGHDLLFLHIRHLQEIYGDVEAVLGWARSVLQAHPDHLVFLTTHEFTGVQGQVLYPALQTEVEGVCNVVAIFSGHRLGGATRGSFTDGCGRTVHHMLTNYQHIEDGGQGNLRIVEIDRLTLEADFSVYSPTLDAERTGEDERFTAALAPLPLVPGDVSCDRRVSIADAIFAAQLSVGIRTERFSCPLPSPTGDANRASADVNADGQVSVSDAVFIAQCSASLPNVLCPDPIG